MVILLFSNAYSTLKQKASLEIRNDANILSKPDVLDRWEMKASSIVFGNIIGKGAFGQVFSAEIEECKLSSMYKSKRKDSAKKGKQSKESVKVAVKVLKGKCGNIIGCLLCNKAFL